MVRRRSIGIWNEQTDAARVLCVEPSAALGEVRPVHAIPRSSAVDLIVGPEGGWSVPEVAVGPRFWRYPDVARRPHAARRCGADCRVDGVTYDLG